MKVYCYLYFQTNPLLCDQSTLCKEVYIIAMCLCGSTLLIIYSIQCIRPVNYSFFCTPLFVGFNILINCVCQDFFPHRYPFPVNMKIKKTLKMIKKQAKLRKKQPTSETSSSSTSSMINIGRKFLFQVIQICKPNHSHLNPLHLETSLHLPHLLITSLNPHLPKH